MQLLVKQSRPFFAEVPYYLWGEVNYDSDGDCRFPTDREWTELEVRNRENQEWVYVEALDSHFKITASRPDLAARLSLLFIARSDGVPNGFDPTLIAGQWAHEAGMQHSQRVRDDFQRPELKPFDSLAFWGGWKWVGWYATEMTWTSRWIMNSVLLGDKRAVPLGIDWLRAVPRNATQSEALRYALGRLTGLSFSGDLDWVRWYDEGGHKAFPEPDMGEWRKDQERA